MCRAAKTGTFSFRHPEQLSIMKLRDREVRNSVLGGAAETLPGGTRNTTHLLQKYTSIAPEMRCIGPGI